MSRVLFILKRREDFNAEKHNKIGLTTGLYNSASFVCDMLNELNVESKSVVVADNNQIDREVTLYKPTHVIIEAIWVVPDKFNILQKLHPTVTWIIRIHSEMPFMANEGMAIRWFGDYINFKNIILAPNTPRMLRELRSFIRIKNSWTEEQVKEKVIYLPNYYPQEYSPAKTINKEKETIDIACFGAIRPLKNHLLQGLAAIEFAESKNKKLAFHVNAGRIEMKGEPVLNNLRGLFEHMYDRGHKLVMHQWADRKNFLELCSQMDIGLQVSLSETFNIVGADFISQGVPIVSSDEIPWASPLFNAIPVDSISILNSLNKTYDSPKLNVIANRYFLRNYTNKTKEIWSNYFTRGIYV